MSSPLKKRRKPRYVDGKRYNNPAACRNELNAFLTKKFKKNPHYVNLRGILRVPNFADAIGLSNEAVYCWLRSDRISLRGANRIVRAFPTRFKIDNFLPFFSDIDYESIPEKDLPESAKLV